MRGFEASLRGGPVRLTVVRGETRRGIPGLLDPADPTRIARVGTYGQDLFAVRPAFGGGTFQLGITAMRVKDDVESIEDLRVATTEGEATRRMNPAPKENVVAGTDVTLRLFGGRVLLEHHLAASLLANDISGSPITKEQLNDYLEDAGEEPIDLDPADYENFFTINTSLIPLNPLGLTSVAQQARASIRAGSNILTAEWRSIGGSYYTLAYPTLVRDRTGIRIQDSFSALDGALALSGGFERDEDNLDDVKPATTTNTGLFANLSWQASPQSPTVVASIRHASRQNDLATNEDGALDEQSLGLSFGLGIPVRVVESFRTRVNLNVSAINRDDTANPESESRDRYILAGVQGETPDRSSAFTLMYGLNTSQLLAFPDADTDFHRVMGNGRYLVRHRWTATLDGSYTTVSSAGQASGMGLAYDRTEVLAGAEFEWTAASFVTLVGGVVSYKDQIDPDRDTREIVVRLRVHRTF